MQELEAPELAAAGLAMYEEIPSGLPWYTLGLGGAALAAHLVVRRFAKHADPLILPITVLLTGLGLVLMDRLDYAYAQHYPPENYQSAPVAPDQVTWTLIGAALMIALLRGDWAAADASEPRHRAECSGLIAAYLQWHLEHGIRSLRHVERV